MYYYVLLCIIMYYYVLYIMYYIFYDIYITFIINTYYKYLYYIDIINYRKRYF